jgi:hypothetical protein
MCCKENVVSPQIVRDIGKPVHTLRVSQVLRRAERELDPEWWLTYGTRVSANSAEERNFRANSPNKFMLEYVESCFVTI